MPPVFFSLSSWVLALILFVAVVGPTVAGLAVGRHLRNRGRRSASPSASSRPWGLAGRALDDAPVAGAPRLEVDSLNAMIDQQTVRVAALNNRVPNTVLWLEVIAAAVALGLPALFLSLLGRGMVAVIAAAVLVAMLLFVTFDLDRPTRGLVTVPDTPLTSLQASMALPPAAK
jgi:hypothetical protein